MAVTPIKVNYRNIFANGTITAVSLGTSWNNPDRVGDGFINRLATTAGLPTGETTIQVDQGADPTTNFPADRLIIAPAHNLDVAMTLELSSDAAAWTSVLPGSAPSRTPTPGTQFTKAFDKVASGGGNRYWRLRFTKTDESLQVPEIWVSEQIELGVSETAEDGNAVAPMSFPLRPNILVQRTLEGVRSAVERGATLRALRVVGDALSPTAFSDWETFLTAIKNGLNVFYIDDPRGDTWFAEVASIDARELDSPERWTITLQIQEVP